MSFVSVFSVEHALALGLIQNHERVIEAHNSAVLISDAPRNLFEGNTEFVVDPGDVVRLRKRLPRLRSVNMLETEIGPDLASLTQNHWKCLQRHPCCSADPWQSRG